MSTAKPTRWAALTSHHRGEFSAINALNSNIYEEHAWFAMLDEMGHHYIAATLGEGITISEFAQINGIPALYVMRYVQRRLPKDLVADARRAAASVYAGRAGLALELPDNDVGNKNFMGEVALAKARSEHYMTMAERLAPEDYSPPMPTPVLLPPVGINMHFDKVAEQPTIPIEYQIAVDPYKGTGGARDRTAVDAEVVEERVLGTYHNLNNLGSLDDKYRVVQGRAATGRVSKLDSKK